MSFIGGIFNLDGSPVDADELNRMMTAQRITPTEGLQTYLEGPLGLGFDLIHNTPESKYEDQPAVDSSGRFVICGDFRLDNRAELLDLLSIPAAEAARIPDSRLVVESFARSGPPGMDRIWGDFAFTIWDKVDRRLFCAKDRTGFKTMYFYRDPKRFAFSTMIKGLLALEWVPKELDEITTANILIGNNLEHDRTFFRNIKCMVGGNWLSVEPDRFREEIYYRPVVGELVKLGSDEEYAELMAQEVDRAVDNAVRSVHPMAIFLSGGLDSSSVACLAAERLRPAGHVLKSFSSVLPKGYSGPAEDERQYIEAVVRHAGLEPHFVAIENQSAHEGQYELFDLIDQPSNVFYYLDQRLRMAAQAAGCRVALSGNGGDSAISSSTGGYLAELVITGHWLRAWRWARDKVASSGKPLHDVIRREVGGVLAPKWMLRGFRRTRGLKPLSLLDGCYIRPEVAERLRIEERALALGVDVEREIEANSRKNMLDSFFPAHHGRSMGTRTLVTKAYGIEQRDPLMDPKVVQLCINFPPDQFRLNGQPRSLIRRAFKGRVPDLVLERGDKHPYSPNYMDLLHASEGWIERLLGPEFAAAPAWEYIDPERLLATWQEVRAETSWERFGETRLIKFSVGLMAAMYINWFHDIR